MDWQKLLSSKRIRELAGGRASGVADHRTPFQSDFDRLIFSAPVKRLQDKAQVFPLEPNDSVRTRLTHSLEVSCVARGMGQSVGKQLAANSTVSVDQARDFEDICGTAGLVHDLGNPPFGHYGEDAISAWFSTEAGHHAIQPLQAYPELRDDFVRFEGNARTLRLLCRLQVLSDQFGLNITAATLAAGMKYVLPSHRAQGKVAANQSHKKPGFCFSEAEFVRLIRSELGLPECRHPLAYLVEAADDCVYSICDIEDAVKKGIITFDRVIRCLEEHAVNLKFDPSIIAQLGKQAKLSVDGSASSGTNPPRPKLTGKARDEAYMQMFRVYAISSIVRDVCKAFLTHYPQIMDGAYPGELVNDDSAPNARTIVQSAKQLGKAEIYITRQTVQLELRGGHIIQSLLGNLWTGIGPDVRDTPKGRRYYSLISESYKNISEFELEEQLRSHPSIPSESLRRYYDLMLLTDYISGMTDSFASDLQRSLTNG